jgi:hypothetical protein
MALLLEWQRDENDADLNTKAGPPRVQISV